MQKLFVEKYNKNADLVAYAPGRVNIIGEHTDYNGGFVLPIAINMGTQIAIAKRDDTQVNVYSKNMDDTFNFSLDPITKTKIGSWYSYIVGVLVFISKYSDKKLKGADIVIDSDLPMGAGLSSSASLEVCLSFAYAHLNLIKISNVEIAKLSQQVEHKFAGTKCGIMDQMIIACGQKDNALLLDCRSLETQNILLKMDNVSFVICDTGVKHSLALSAYNTRREECEIACEILGVELLRDASLKDLTAQLMPENIFARAKHIISEDIRTLNVVKYMQEQEWQKVGDEMYKSHISLQKDYLVSCDESDFIVSTCKSIKGVFGARITGGGFGGCVIALVEDSNLDAFKQNLNFKYLEKFGRDVDFYISKAMNGVGLK